MARIANCGLTLVAFCLLLFPAETLAQGETTSAIVGQVTDATNAAIPGATVTITNRETGLQRSAKTDDEGRFNFPQLKPGAYSVKVEAEGFDPQQNDNVLSGLGQKQTVNFTLRSPIETDGRGKRRSSSHQSGERKHIHESECAGAGEPSQSRRRFNLPSSVCGGRAHQYGRQRQ